MTRIPKDQRDYLKSKGLWIYAEDRENNTSKSKAQIFEDSAKSANEIHFKDSFLEADVFVNPETVYTTVHMMFDCAEDEDYFREDIPREEFEFGVLSSYVSGVTSRIVHGSDVNPMGLLPPGFSLNEELLERYTPGIGTVATNECSISFKDPCSEIKSLSRAIVQVSSGSRVCDAISSMWLPVQPGDQRTSAILSSRLLSVAKDCGVEISDDEIRPWLFSGFIPKAIGKFSSVKGDDWCIGLSHLFQPYRDGPSFRSVMLKTHVRMVLDDIGLYFDEHHSADLMIEKTLYSVTTDAHNRVKRFADHWHVGLVPSFDMKLRGEPSPYQLCRYKGKEVLGPVQLDGFLPDDFKTICWSSMLWFPRKEAVVVLHRK